MALFKCKMCGGSLEIASGATVIECEYCGTKQTLPKLDDDKRANMYDRANHFRRNNEFDKAMGIYEHILNEDNTDAEAYWSIVLCRYGIEYVEDPASRKRIPTVNRAQFTSILADEDYKSALANADAHQKSIYELEAKAIDTIQKGILAISQKEEPFDVFICYKETDHNGRRTLDSVLAQELYFGLKNEGFKVFFSRITLEDKLGSAYEPYIFAALNSAKVMVVLGTKPEHFNAVWVKNEWSRYLALIQQGQKKMLIPAYKDMNPYDLPEEFSHLQAQDMSKLGFMQDLIRGIKKIIKAPDAKPTVVKETIVTAPVINAGIVPLLKRTFIFLEDGEFDRADDFCEQVLNQDPENAQAYLAKLMVELQVKRQADLPNCAEPFDNNKNYQKAVRFADATLAAELRGYTTTIKDRNAKKVEEAKRERTERIYSQALSYLNSQNTENEYREAARLFNSIRGYKDADELAAKCSESAEIARKDDILATAKDKMANDVVSLCSAAIQLFGSIPGWRDADEQKQICIEKMDALIARDNAERKRQAEMKLAEAERIAKERERSIRTVIITFVVGIVAIILFCWVGSSSAKHNAYNNAMALLEIGMFDEAYAKFSELGNYKDSAEQAENARILQNKRSLTTCYVGKSVTLGEYEQDDYASTGKEAIEWVVLDIKYGKALVTSKYALDNKPFNDSCEDVTWETSTLRKWLNNDFLNSAFTDEEKKWIATTTVSADSNPNPYYISNPGKATQDKIFLLSINEVNKYFEDTSATLCQPTKYAYGGGYDVSSIHCSWRLRTPGYSQSYTAVVKATGAIDNYGIVVDGTNTYIRPAMWIDLSKIS